MLRQLRYLFFFTSLIVVFAFHGLVDAKQAIINVDVINVRSGPGTEYDLIHKLSKNAAYPIVEEKDDWYKITYDTNKTGWIAGWYVTVQESLQNQPTNSGNNASPGNTAPGNATTGTAGNTTSGNPAPSNPSSAVPGNAASGNAITGAGKTQVVESTIQNLNVRSGPSTTFSIVKAIHPNEFYPVVNDNGEWMEIQLTEQMNGWVAKQFVKVTTRNTETVVKAKSVTVTVGILNLRAEPNTSSTILDKLTQGQNVELLEAKDNWYKVRTNGITGWVASEYVRQNVTDAVAPPGATTPNGTDSATPAPNGSNTSPQPNNTGDTNTSGQEKPTENQAIINATVLNIRSGPGTTYDSIGKLQQNDVVKILEQKDEWLKISFGSTEGWVAGEYVTVQKATPSVSEVPKVIVPTNGINIRSGPGTNFDVVLSANEGDTFNITKTDGDWYEIALPNAKKGYIASWVVKTDGIVSQNNDSSVAGLLKGKTIVVDAGHGGIDSGVIGSYYKTLEKDLTLPTALLLESKLKAAGANVIMTRNKDVYLNLQQRVNVSVNHKADAFISIHYNSNHNSSINGTIVYHYTASGEDAKLAKIIQQEMVHRNGMTNLGARQDNFYVLRENPQLAVLVEVAFLSNKNDEQISRSSSFQEKSAEGVFQGILKYFNK